MHDKTSMFPSGYLSKALAHGWWLLLLRGIAALLFGVLTLAQPGASATVLLLLFAIYAMADGVIGIWSAVVNRRANTRWWSLVLWGIASILAGLVALFAPSLVLAFAIAYIAFWAIATGVLQIAAAIRLRKEIAGEWLLIAAGALSVLFGLLLIVNPLAGLISIMGLIAFYAVVFGTLLTVLAFRVRRLRS
ncbi:HdeD family acid-resistance protein [Lampropedia cohaerens]|nr:HdeD family acid-resistance protein [Lampropedia cohaerens]